MPWLELSLTLPADRQPDCEDALEALGALSVTLQDADAETPDERAIFEPGVDQTPLWNRVVLTALFEDDADRSQLAAALREALPELQPSQLDFREVADQDWERAWMDQFKPMRFGRRLWIVPWNDEAFDEPDAVVVRLDPGLAFGTGTHPTTALCLEWLDGLDLDGVGVTDYGCGSGVLAIAALKLGAAHALGVDNDPQALTATRDNAERNGVGGRLDVHLPEDAPDAPADVFVANILAGPLGELAERFAALVKPGAPFALSGILDGQQHELLERYAPWFENLRTQQREDWIRIDGRRRA
ncbi:50S ribosomal protein L11 methyltransferase [Oleiagrimonas soli]|uniref:Ribosomal protein L11 methyltransferase n=1 Tax=Oleiagrimonas soli TaxID=1543381 RepID=A0A099CYK4_9GAMM|nr:50S ribosomal protein L11 methyltransferase [Oleiagrimonas soli]KGI78766.1 ribosomal protein L11 methyltransferase [Oleiagrimonas soli]MBB6184470.1 ribosomal protein L11 methyltransferase [Oleiagrimonas soli]